MDEDTKDILLSLTEANLGVGHILRKALMDKNFQVCDAAVYAHILQLKAAAQVLQDYADVCMSLRK